MNRKVKILGKSFYSPSLKDVAGLGSIQLHFNFPYIFLCFSCKLTQFVGKKIIGHIARSCPNRVKIIIENGCKF